MGTSKLWKIASVVVTVVPPIIQFLEPAVGLKQMQKLVQDEVAKQVATEVAKQLGK